ncbi:hypothetical protein BGW36DRAFT_378979, partial [Talaromyces proteolyticus]
MAYNAIAQVDDIHDAASLSSDSDASHPVEVQSAHIDADHADHAAPAASLLSSTLSHLKQSRSYDIVEDDDYEEEHVVDPTSATTNDHPSKIAPATAPEQQASIVRYSNAEPTSPEPRLRSSSGSSSFVLRHPTPDLQSLQGAYVGNIERLEKSAERLSLTSSDLGVELRKLDLEQKQRSLTSSTQQGPESPLRQFSSGSMSNSIIGVNNAARSGGYSPGGFLSSPRGSILSGPRFRSTSVSSPLQDIHEPKQDEDSVQPSDDSLLARELLGELPQPSPLDPGVELQHTHLPDLSLGILERPLTAHSTDTYQQATDLFLDFDGVHYVPHPKEPSLSHQVSLNRTPVATTAEHHEKPRGGQDMIYYPAPIPKVLNLPQRLSKRPVGPDQEKRRTQLLSSALNAAKDGVEGMHNAPGKRLSAIPPQLRASVFFDQPSTPLNVKIKNKSAVDTLDSILDASAHAPVTAFTDHPIVGSAGREVYATKKRDRSSRMLADQGDGHRSRSSIGLRDSTLNLAAEPSPGLPHSDTEIAEDKPLHDTHGMYDTHSHSSHSRSHSSDISTGESYSEGEESVDEVEEWENEELNEQVLSGRPTTLLAELEIRKHEQKQRNRTAATAFPNGMHSTLLQLDAVAQAQSNKRRQKHVTLAWEAEAIHDSDEADDEDVPLGVLYGSKHPALEERPLGLMERRELEENEPLSKRRARLRGEAPPEVMPHGRSSVMLRVPPGGQAESDSGNDEETLAQRIQRLKAENRDKSKSIISVEFENEIMAELGKLHEPVAPEPASEKQPASQPRESAPAEEEETLGQRRKRLQAEAKIRKSQSTTDINNRRSMADILHAYPSAGAGGGMSSLDQTHAYQNSWDPRMAYQQNRSSTTYTLPPSMMYHPGLGQVSGYGGVPGHDPQLPYGAYALGMPYPQNANMLPSVIDPRQREVIDRWRQSIM